ATMRAARSGRWGANRRSPPPSDAGSSRWSSTTCASSCSRMPSRWYQQANVATLRARGAVVVEPASGRLTGRDTGPGRLPEPAELFEVARHVLARGPAGRDLAGRHVVVSAGGTREPIDP